MAYMAISSGESLNERYWKWLGNTITLSTITAICAVAIAVWLAYSARLAKGGLQQMVNRMVSLGYAVPGAVLAVGILVLLGQLDIAWLISGSVVVLVYACLLYTSDAADE